MCGRCFNTTAMTPKMIKETALGLTEDDSIRRGRHGVQVVSFSNRQHLKMRAIGWRFPGPVVDGGLPLRS